MANWCLIEESTRENCKGEYKMESWYTVLVVNGVFEEENVLIVKSKGETITARYDELITPLLLQEKLEKEGINIDECKLVVVDKDWKGNPKVEQF